MSDLEPGDLGRAAKIPYDFVRALDSLGIPSVTFGHTAKGATTGDPFGSVGWINAMRLTWLGVRGSGASHNVRWRARKRNERGHIPGVMLTFDYGDDLILRDVTREDDDEATQDWLIVALRGEPRPMGSLVEEWFEDRDDPPPQSEETLVRARLGKVLQRGSKGERPLFVKDGNRGPNVKWALRFEP